MCWRLGARAGVGVGAEAGGNGPAPYKEYIFFGPITLAVTGVASVINSAALSTFAAVAVDAVAVALGVLFL